MNSVRRPHEEDDAHDGREATTSVGHLRIPDISGDMTALDAALAYAADGWHVLPVRRRTKHPGSVLGNGWHKLSTRDPAEIAALWAGTDHGVALHVGRSGAVVIDVDHPENIPPDMADAMRPLAAPWQRTRRDEAHRGHLVFAQPSRRLIGNGLGSLPKGWGEVRGANGIIVVAPSTHEKDNGLYEWVRTGPVPELPAWIADRLTDASPADDAATDATIQRVREQWQESRAPALLKAVTDRWDSEVGGHGASRHDTAVKLACWTARDARAGLYPLTEGLDALHGRWERDIAKPIGGRGSVSEAEARREWNGIVAWAVGQALAEPQETIDRRAVLAGPTPTSGLPAGEPIPHDPVTGEVLYTPSTDKDNDDPHDPALEEAVFGATDMLQRVRAHARGKWVSPWAFLGAALPRIVCAAPDGAHIDTGIGNPAVLSMISVIVAPSGGGKSLLDAPVRQVFGYAYETQLRSGEGLTRVFISAPEKAPKKGEAAFSDPDRLEGDPRCRWLRRTAVLVADESDHVKTVDERQGSTLTSVLRTMWTGGQLGGEAADAGRSGTVPPGSYRAGMIINTQPKRAGWMVGEDSEAGGFMQRLAMFSAIDPAVSDDDPPEVTLSWTPPIGRPRLLITLPGEALTAFREQHRRRLRGHTEGIDSHALLSRAKLAAGLALLHGSWDVTSELWVVSAAVWEHTRRVRDQVIRTVRAESATANRARGKAQGEREVAAGEVIDTAALGKTVAAVLKKITDAGDAGRTHQRLSRDMPRHRDRLRDALDRLVDSGQVVVKTEPGQGQDSTVYRAPR